jgi:hypothetical protein
LFLAAALPAAREALAHLVAQADLVIGTILVSGVRRTQIRHP